MAKSTGTGKRLAEIVLMPVVIALVGIFGTIMITIMQHLDAHHLAEAQLEGATQLANAQLESARERSKADRQVKVLEIFNEKIASDDPHERALAIRLLRAIEPDLAETITELLAEQPDTREVAQAELNKRISLEVAVTPDVTSPGQKTTIKVTALTADGNGLPGARVRISTGGGKFLQSPDERYNPRDRLHSPYSATGLTDTSGEFTTWWVCNPCSSGYGMGIEVSKDDYIDASKRFAVRVTRGPIIKRTEPRRKRPG